MYTVSVHAAAAYEVLIENGILDRAGEEIRKISGGARVMIVTDDTVDALYGARLEASLTAAGIEHRKFVIPHGEASKNVHSWIALLNTLAEAAFTRTDMLCALGGGVVGDLTGFAAASFLRGIKYVGIPTTLLAMVDSSVGGKTAIDLDAGKNLCGAFHHPSLVLCDPTALSTLTPEIFSDGMAEVIKYGVIGDRGLFDLLKDPDSLPLEEVSCTGIIAVYERMLYGNGAPFDEELAALGTYHATVEAALRVSLGRSYLWRRAIR